MVNFSFIALLHLGVDPQLLILPTTRIEFFQPCTHIDIVCVRSLQSQSQRVYEDGGGGGVTFLDDLKF